MKKACLISFLVCAVMALAVLLGWEPHLSVAGLPLLGFAFGTIDVDLYSPVTMMEPLEIRKPPKTVFKDTFFSGQPDMFHDTQEVLVDKLRQGEEVAVYCAPTHDGKAVDREGYMTNKVKAAYVKPFRPLTFQDLIPRDAGETLMQPQGVAGRLQAKAARLLGRDMVQLEDLIIRREEAMCAEVLETGQIHVVGEGVDFVVDFLMPAANKGTLVGDALFTSAFCDPYTWLYGLFRGMVVRGWRTPKKMFLGGNVIDPFITNPNVKDRLSTQRAIDSGRIKPQELPDGTTYQGTINVNGYQIDVYGYDASYTENGVRKYIMPQDKIIVGPGETTNHMCYGAIQHLKAAELGMVEKKRFPNTYTNQSGSIRYLQIESSPLPNHREADNFACFKVI